MYLTDYHTHSNFSFDGKQSITEILDAAKVMGLSKIAVTDHADPPPRHYDAEPIRQTVKEATAYAEALGIKLLFGAELGDPHLGIPWAKETLLKTDYDIVICSLHELSGFPGDSGDFYCIDYRDEAHCHELLKLYLEQHMEYFSICKFDILGHLGYPLRYMAKQGFFPDFSLHSDALKQLFAEMIKHKVALEVNTSSIYGTLGKANPDETILRMYYACGGRLAATGSDAHYKEHVGRGIAEAHEVLEQMGFSVL